MLDKMIRAFGNRLGFSLLVFLLGTLLSCGGEQLTPLVRLRITPIPDGADKMVLSVTIDDVTRKQEFTASDSFDLVTVGFPVGTTGNVTVSLVVYSGVCLVGSGSGLLKLENDEVRELPISLTKPDLACGTPAAKLIVQLIDASATAGSVSAVVTADGIDCGSDGSDNNDCEEIYPVGTSVTLHARAPVGFLVSWLGVCKGNGDDCTLTLDSRRDQIVQASFQKCVSGWCPDPRVPAGFNSTLYGIVGDGDDDIFAVGQSGKVLHFDGKNWTEEQSGVVENLRAVTKIRGISPALFVAVGDNGRAIYHYSIKLPPPQTPPPWVVIPAPSNGLRSVVGEVSSDETLCAVGDDGTVLTGNLRGLRREGSVPMSFAGKTLNAVTLQNPKGSTTQVAIVGEMGFGSKSSFPASSVIYDTLGMPPANLLNGVWYGTSRLVAVGGMDTKAAIFSRSYSNNSWQTWTGQRAPDEIGILRAVWGSADNFIWAVGDAGSIVRCYGSTWTKFQSPTKRNLNAIWGTTNNLYAVGDQGTLLRYIW